MQQNHAHDFRNLLHRNLMKIYFSFSLINSAMRRCNYCSTPLLIINGKCFSYVGSVQYIHGWKHRFRGTLRGTSNCWIFCKALRVFPPSMWSVNIERCSTDIDIHCEEDKHLCPSNCWSRKGISHYFMPPVYFMSAGLMLSLCYIIRVL